MMKISKTRLKEIIKEEINETFEDRLARAKEIEPGVDFEAEETALNSPREAGRQWAYENIVNTVGDLVREALEGHGLDADSIRDAIAEALDEELGPEEIELGEGAKLLPGSTVRRKSDGKIGYRTVGTKTGAGSRAWNIKWSGESVEKDVPRNTFTIEKDK